LGNYAITYVNNTMEVTNDNLLIITANDQTKTYGDVFTFNGTEFTVTGLLGSDSVTSVTLTSAGTASAAVVGTHAIVPSAAVGSGLGNYTIIYTSGTMTVTPRDLVFTPDNKTKTYGDVFTAYTGSFNLNGLRAGDIITPNYDSLGAPATALVGPYDINVTLSDPGNKLGNYNVTVNTGTLTVQPRALIITANNQTKVYGDVFTFLGTEFTTNVNGLMNGDTVDTVTLTSAGAPAAALASPPTYPIVPSLAVGSGLSNYTISYVNGALTVTKPNLVVTSDSYSKIYGDVFSAFTGSIVGIRNGDNITATYASAGSPANAAFGSYDINITLVDPTNKLPNYNVTYNVGKLTVTRRDRHAHWRCYRCSAW
jgi:hypothetical protein